MQAMTDSDSIQALTALGFTGVEAEVYVALLRHSPATGYRIAQALGRPAAGVYKTLESLARKGAVLVEEGAGRACRAVPPDELLARLDRSFEQRKAEAERALSELRAAPEDQRIYQLRTREQVLERCRAMLERCEQIALVDVFPGPLAAVRADLEAAAARGARVAVQVYEPAEVAGARINQFAWGRQILERAPWQLLIVLVDGAELLWALFEPGGREVRQAFWTNSAALAYPLHGFVATEFVFGAVMSDPDLPPEVREIVRKHSGFIPGIFSVRGYELLMAAYPSPGE
ncbi:MAG TPA: helix-turn-helix domain-containing protein [Armatimonadota bacterium]|nr:helix-turn-helix domain-containing protein [Armatimonadota bacterium]